MEVEGQSSHHESNAMDDSAENSNKRNRDNGSEEDLFSSLEENETQSHHRRLKKKKVVAEAGEVNAEEQAVEVTPGHAPLKQEVVVKDEPDSSDVLESDLDDEDEDVKPLVTHDTERPTPRTSDSTTPAETRAPEADSPDAHTHKSHKRSDSKQLASELFADESEEEGLLSGSELPPDFPDDLSEGHEEERGEQVRDSGTRDHVAAYVSDEDFSDEERLGDFIVDAEGKPVRMAKETPRRTFGSGAITGEQLTVAQDVFFGDQEPEEFFRDHEAFGVTSTGYGFDVEEAEMEEEEVQQQLASQFASAAEMRQESYRLLAQRLEPSELAEHFASKEDDRIVATDVPERMQLRTPDRTWRHVSQLSGEGDEESVLVTIGQEAEWIYAQAFSERAGLALDQETVVHCITQVLRLLLLEHFEIPFIASYRKEYWNTSNPKQTDEEQDSSLGVDDLWDIYDWDEKWYHLQLKKSKLIEQFRAVEEVCLTAFIVLLLLYSLYSFYFFLLLEHYLNFLLFLFFFSLLFFTFLFLSFSLFFFFFFSFLFFFLFLFFLFFLFLFFLLFSSFFFLFFCAASLF
jgi:hypothetical protein